jgi:hypothetical protein
LYLFVLREVTKTLRATRGRTGQRRTQRWRYWRTALEGTWRRFRTVR